AFRRLGVTNDAARIVVGNETLGNYIKEKDGYDEQHPTDQDRERTIFECELQRPAITSDQPFVSMLGFLPPCAFWWFNSIRICVSQFCTLPNGRVSARRIHRRQWFA